MKYCLIFVFLLAIVFPVFSYPFESDFENPIWVEILFDIDFFPMKHNDSKIGIGMEVNLIFEDGIGIGIGGFFAEYINLSIMGLYYPRIIDSDLLLFPFKLRLGGSLLYDEWIMNASISGGVKTVFLLDVDEFERHSYLTAEALITFQLYLIRFDGVFLDIIPELNSGMLGESSVDDEMY